MPIILYHLQTSFNLQIILGLRSFKIITVVAIDFRLIVDSLLMHSTLKYHKNYNKVGLQLENRPYSSASNLILLKLNHVTHYQVAQVS